MISTPPCGPGPQSTLSELPSASSWASSRTSRSRGCPRTSAFSDLSCCSWQCSAINGSHRPPRHARGSANDRRADWCRAVPAGITAGLIGDHDRLIRITIIGGLTVLSEMLLFAYIVFRTAAPKGLPGRGPKRQSLSFMRILIQATVWLVLVADSSASLAEDTAPSCAQINGKAMLQADLFFGRDIAARSRVSRAQWSDFLGREVTRRFPNGLTVFAAFGEWRDTGSRRITREPSFVVRVIAAETPETMEGLTQIRSAYMQRFHQQSVGLTLSTTCASF